MLRIRPTGCSPQWHSMMLRIWPTGCSPQWAVYIIPWVFSFLALVAEKVVGSSRAHKIMGSVAKITKNNTSNFLAVELAIFPTAIKSKWRSELIWGIYRKCFFNINYIIYRTNMWDCRYYKNLMCKSSYDNVVEITLKFS